MCDCCGKNTGQGLDRGTCAKGQPHDHHKDDGKPAGPVFTIIEPAPRKNAEPGS